MPLAVVIVLTVCMFVLAMACNFSAVDQHSVAINCQLKPTVALEQHLPGTVWRGTPGILESRCCRRMRFFNLADIHENTFATLMVLLEQTHQSLGMGSVKMLLQTDMKVVITDAEADSLSSVCGVDCFHKTSQVRSDEKLWHESQSLSTKMKFIFKYSPNNLVKLFQLTRIRIHLDGSKKKSLLGA